MIKEVRLVHFKGFARFSAHLKQHSILLGPNNAGKSTLVNAIRLCGAASRVAMRQKPTEWFRDDGRVILGFPLSLIADDGYDFGNIAHEFSEGTSKLQMKLDSGASVHVVWPDRDAPFFWMEDDGSYVTNAARSKQVLDRIGLVPTLTPVDRQERLLSREHLQSHAETRLASRHFRNNLRAVQAADSVEYAELVAYIIEHTPEITSLDVETAHRDGGTYLDLYFRHPDSRVRKEIVWAGDGLQIWIQILFHLWRTRDRRVVVLDEPDVFLHPDLQRRLVRVIEERSGQTILASHSSEVAGEASSSSLVWIDRTRRSSRAVGDDDHEMEQLAAVLGTSFNLAIAKALRARTALFVEGEDMKILRVLAKKVGAARLASELGIAIVPIGGFSHWPSVEAFSWIKTRFLGKSVRVRVLLDRDYRSDEEVAELVEQLALSDVDAHVWRRKEIESYLIEPAAVARVSGADLQETEAKLDSVLEALRPEVAGQISKSYLGRKAPAEDTATAIARATTMLDSLWSERSGRLSVSPAKRVITAWNRDAASIGARPVSAIKLARSIRLSEISPEMVDFLLAVEADL